jgi:hypothetical protein
MDQIEESETAYTLDHALCEGPEGIFDVLGQRLLCAQHVK